MHNPLPDSLNTLIDSPQWQLIIEGESDAMVYRLIDSETRYLKISKHNAQSRVKTDYERLTWLSGKVPVPDVLYYTEDDTYQYLLLSECPGLHPFHSDLSWTVQARIDVMVESAKAFHSLPIDTCPYRITIDEQIEIAQHNVERGQVHIDHRNVDNQGRTVEDLFNEFIALRPEKADFVVTHGDLYPVNVRVDADTHDITGFIDVGAMAIADRYTDFAPIVNAIGWHYDKKWIDQFFAQYGIPLDRDRLRFYQLFQQFS